jgi:dTDP-glucose 4,6-dehydratase
MRKLNNILITGGAGFIGSNFIHYSFNSDFDGRIINVDKLTYAGNLENLEAVKSRYEGKRYFFERVDIGDYQNIRELIRQYHIDTVVHFAAESHVDRSIYGPKEFIQTNILGTFSLLEAVRESWSERNDVLFHHISTDEVYGSLGPDGFFYEQTPYAPRSPYAASKASSDHLVMAYHHTYGIPVTLTNCSNNYGPYQFPEKLIPLMILRMMEEKNLPVYGDGKHVRDWLYVDDHSAALWLVLREGNIGEPYNIGGESECENIKLVEMLCDKMDLAMAKEEGHYRQLITSVQDRPGHDRRYALNCDKIKGELGWSRTVSLDAGLDRTIRWYLENGEWLKRVQSGEYRQWIERHYHQ